MGVWIEEQPEARGMDRWGPAVSSVTGDWERDLCRAPCVGRVWGPLCAGPSGFYFRETGEGEGKEGPGRTRFSPLRSADGDQWVRDADHLSAQDHAARVYKMQFQPRVDRGMGQK